MGEGADAFARRHAGDAVSERHEEEEEEEVEEEGNRRTGSPEVAAGATS